MQVITCDVAEQEFVVDMHSVDEVIEMMAYREFPDAPAFVVGMINLREELVPVVDLYERLGRVRPSGMMTEETSPFPVTSRLLITTCGGQRIGGIVNGVGDIIFLDENDLEQAVGADRDRHGLLGRVWLTDSGMVQLMDFRNLLSPHELSRLCGTS